MTVIASNLGFPRMGSNRDLKKLVEAYWGGKITADALLAGAKALRETHWKLQSKFLTPGYVPSNDFSMYDHALDHAFLFGAVPERYASIPSKVDQYFAMGRGLQRPAEGIDVPAMEMKKWFDTNYHFIVPEFSPKTEFHLHTLKPVDEFLEAKALGIATRPVVLGPVSFLALGKGDKHAPAGFQTLSLLDRLLPVYTSLLNKLEEAGATAVQIDEPILALDQPAELKAVFAKAYAAIRAASPRLSILVASYFGTIGANIDFVADLPIDAIHVDLVRAPGDLDLVLPRIAASATKAISVGVVNGRNIWKNDLAKSVATVQRAVAAVGASRVLVAPSCSLLHSPHSLEAEVKMNPAIKLWMAFAVQKLEEISVIAKAAVDPASVADELAANKAAIEDRKVSPLIHDPAVQAELRNLSPSMFRRTNDFAVREKVQQAKLKLPSFPTTTVGSFPQTKEVRVARQKLKKGELSEAEYDAFIKAEIEKAVRFQEAVGLDMLVHGEFERNDMVEFFGENMRGYVFSQNGWVQSYGSRCVKPPIIFGDVSRPTPMTVETSVYAQSLTAKPMKGMLTGPVTMLQWSFVRDDQPRKDTTFQIALALRKEVADLEAAGLPAIQIDEPAIREGLPLRASEHKEYLDWAVNAFLLSSTGVKDETQIHTHMCYSDFNDIFQSISDLDADCITIENSKSDLKLLSAFEKHGYTRGIGPGLYDIHSPRVPPAAEIKERLEAISKLIDKRLLWVNPDCGLKTRGWAETEAALKNMCDVAKQFRAADVA
ncbi:methionine-synthesizing 5-methyltetrahydropteroyltriglutamate--homocysteine methyltransferase [Polyrhizophydium stewartii]|uniref:5-methyltetrahydropteroyltriglutamate--homocysteine S-methyltransferase n=1 Tax=Polyrhizophydium stewartii TaxID=2732419 RepID=A0ABR4NA18_9FUNG